MPILFDIHWLKHSIRREIFNLQFEVHAYQKLTHRYGKPRKTTLETILRDFECDVMSAKASFERI